MSEYTDREIGIGMEVVRALMGRKGVGDELYGVRHDVDIWLDLCGDVGRLAVAAVGMPEGDAEALVDEFLEEVGEDEQDA